ncbi:hypothetical protein HMPREF1084_02995 [Clostridium butyricum 60E.3]|uniref:hypothetical protein n=1 Tax=Clostridium TaxID=1485 RepID=UPI0002D1DB5D|nr:MULTISPECIES: hypothetical protein [Clostridium]ENZ31476.1 hypothetical protein HMPREF1084_02995 [Clostridium butyricum 60E.3]UZT06957.1 hypothetical protein ONV75_03600 [Clostridium sp. LQ25]
MIKLEEYLREYKALTLDIIERVNEDGSIGYLLDERQVILEEIKKSDFEESDIKRICNNLNIVELEKELNICINQEIVNTKRKMSNLKKMKTANMNYASIGYVPSRFNKHM